MQIVYDPLGVIFKIVQKHVKSLTSIGIGIATVVSKYHSTSTYKCANTTTYAVFFLVPVRPGLPAVENQCDWEHT